MASNDGMSSSSGGVDSNQLQDSSSDVHMDNMQQGSSSNMLMNMPSTSNTTSGGNSTHAVSPGDGRYVHMLLFMHVFTG